LFLIFIEITVENEHKLPPPQGGQRKAKKVLDLIFSRPFLHQAFENPLRAWNYLLQASDNLFQASSNLLQAPDPLKMPILCRDILTA